MEDYNYERVLVLSNIFGAFAFDNISTPCYGFLVFSHCHFGARIAARFDLFGLIGWIGFSIPQVDKYELGNDFRGITIKSTKAFSNAIDGENNVVVKEADEKRAVVEAPGGYNFIIENEDVAKGDPVQRVSVGVSRDGVEGFLVQYYRATHLLAGEPRLG